MELKDSLLESVFLSHMDPEDHTQVIRLASKYIEHLANLKRN